MEETVATVARFALDVAFKATVLLSLTALALVSAKRASAAVRQLVATLGLAGALALPLATLFAPRWEIPLLPSPVPDTSPARIAFGFIGERASDSMTDVDLPRSGRRPVAIVERERPVLVGETSAPSSSTNATNGVVELSTRKAFEPDSGAPKTSSSPTGWMFGTLALWSAGTLLASIRLALGAVRVARIRRHASDQVDEEWTALSSELAVKLGLARPVRLLFSEDLAVPVTTGLRRPVVLLPEGARRWNEERRRVVLLHEIAHVRRADWLALLIGQAAAALYWFHPIAWSTRTQMQKDCERACDDLVLAAGTRASVYAAHLLSIIRSLRLSGQRTLPAVAMARRSYWDGRMRAILDPAVTRRVVSRREARLAVGALVAAVVALAVLEPWAPRRADAMSSDRLPAIDLGSAAKQLESSCKEESSGAKAAINRQVKSGKNSSVFLSEASVSGDPETPSPDEAVTVEATPPEPAFVQAGKKHKSDADWYSRGMELHNDARYDEAIEAFRHSIEEGHRVEAATYNIACGYARKGDADRALEWLHKAADEGFELASYIDRDDDLDSLRSDPRFRELRRVARAEKIEASRHRADRLAERFRELQASRNAKGGAFYSLGKDLLEVGRYDVAAQAFQTSAARGHREGASLYNTGCALSLKGDREGALDFLQKALEAGFDDPDLFRKDDDLDNVRGEPRYRELLKMAEDLELHRFDDNWNHKSWTRSARRGAWREVEQHFLEYTQRHPQSARGWFNLGYARIEGERPEAAIEAFQRALDLRYRIPTTMYNLACAYSLIDRKDEAFSWLFKALDAGFEGEGMIRSDDDLDNLRGDPRFRQALEGQR
jgi:beta-lactamase regulating signal transducer with metallopeptidase domain/tetratricopeptide (TPR) repeat protein